MRGACDGALLSENIDRALFFREYRPYAFIRENRPCAADTRSTFAHSHPLHRTGGSASYRNTDLLRSNTHPGMKETQPFSLPQRWRLASSSLSAATCGWWRRRSEETFLARTAARAYRYPSSPKVRSPLTCAHHVMLHLAPMRLPAIAAGLAASTAHSPLALPRCVQHAHLSALLELQRTPLACRTLGTRPLLALCAHDGCR